MRAPLRNRIEALEASAPTDESVRCIFLVGVFPGERQPKVIGVRSGTGSKSDWHLPRKPKEDLAAFQKRAGDYARAIVPAPNVAIAAYEYCPDDVARVKAEHEAKLHADDRARATALPAAKASR